MSKWKKMLLTMTIGVLAAVSLSACSGGAKTSESAGTQTAAESETTKPEATTAEASGKKSIVCTSFPQYDFVREILGDNPAGIDITYLLANGVDMHNYQASAEDMVKIRSSDLFLYVGGESEQWVEDIKKQSAEGEFQAVALIDLVESKTEEIVEGMEHEHNHSHSTAFEDSEVQDRALTDWAGDWQSIYPYLQDGTLDPVMEHKAEESGGKTAAEYFDYYNTGYQTEVDRIVIDDHSIEFHKEGSSVKADYEYKGFKILTYESGNKGVRYLFEAVGDANGAPRFVQFSDHEIAPVKAGHYHLYWGDESAEVILNEVAHWPTYFPAGMDGNQIVNELIGDDHSHNDDDELDEHVWLSLKNAVIIVNAISDEICSIDPDHADIYKENAAAYIGRLEALDTRYTDAVKTASRKTILVADRFPFRYLADDYGLVYYAAFPGCSAETEASFETVVFLAEKVSELQLPSIFIIDGSDGSIAKTVVENSRNTGTGIDTLNSLQSVSQKDMEAGLTYLSAMEDNLEQLKKALD